MKSTLSKTVFAVKNEKSRFKDRLFPFGFTNVNNGTFGAKAESPSFGAVNKIL